MTSEEAPSIIIATLYEIDQFACGLEPTAAIQVGDDVSRKKRTKVLPVEKRQFDMLLNDVY